VFFVISGFIIWTQALRPDAAPASFFWRRLTRVAPAYWLASAVIIALAAAWPSLMPEVALSARHIALSLAFIPHTDPEGRVFPVLPPGWTLTYEAAFYALVTAALFAPSKARFALTLAGLAAFAAAGFAWPPIYRYVANPLMLEFAAGAGLAQWTARGGRIAPGAGLVFGGLGAALLAAMWLGGVQDALLRPLLWGLPAGMIVAGALAIEPVKALTPPRALIQLGDASYAIYLCHLPVVALVAAAVGWPHVWIFIPAAIAASTIAGLTFHRFVERPLIVACRTLPERLAVRGETRRWPAPRATHAADIAPTPLIRRLRRHLLPQGEKEA
jgi:exopolysaccharide production protein ExoZ